MADPKLGSREPLRSPVLGTMPHGFMTRRGGVSQGALSGLQCGFGAEDDPVKVLQNRALAVAAVAPGAQLVLPYQVHSAKAAVVTAPFADDARPEVDAVATDRPGLALGIVTADCVPILLADSHNGVIGAAHAGWRGARDGVIEAVVAAMETLGAARGAITAAIGPCIAPESYEVDGRFRAAFGLRAEPHLTPGRPGRWQFDLPGFVATQLTDAGVTQSDDLRCDTYIDATRFYSYRRATHRGEASYGRQLSLIALPR